MSADRLEHALAALRAGEVPVPPSEEIFIGDGDYLKIAAEFLGFFVEFGGLQPHHRVLDVGCGIGRMASGLSRYLDPLSGFYVGFDPVRSGVDWCRAAYADQANFRFEWADIYNELYRPEGQILSTEYRFPAGDASTDFAIATSVFTHLYEPEISAYFTELKRVLKPQGTVFSTAYLFDGDRPFRSDVRFLAFDDRDDDYPHRWHVSGTPPLSAVCYSESYFSRLVEARTGRTPTIHAGGWRGGPGPWFQDLVLL